MVRCFMLTFEIVYCQQLYRIHMSHETLVGLAAYENINQKGTNIYNKRQTRHKLLQTLCVI